MSDQSCGVTLYDAEDVLPLGLVGTPWEVIFKALRDVLKPGVGASDSDFMRKACALYFLARGDLDAVTDRDVLNGIAAALAIPYWVENFDDPTQASAILYHWISYKATRAKLTALALASGMRAFKLREIYTSTEFGLLHSFGFDLGDGYEASFFAGPDAEPGFSTAQRICGALTHFFLRIKDSPTLITDITYPEAAPSGWQYFFRPDQAEIRILQAVRWDLFDSEGSLAFSPDEYAVIRPTAVRNKYGINTSVSSLSEILILADGQLKLVWGQAPTDAYCLYADVTIDIPGMAPAWPSLSHTDVNIAPNMIPGLALYMIDGSQVTGRNWSIFAAYDSDLHRVDSGDLYLVGTSPVRLRSRKYVRLCQVWLVPPFIAGGTISSSSEHIIYSTLMTGLLARGGYAYSDGALLGMNWDFGGLVEEDVQGLPIVHTLNGIIGTLSQQGPQASTGIGDSVYHYNCDNGAYQLTTVDSGSAVAVVTISDFFGDKANHGIGWVAERTSNGNVKITNNTSSAFSATFGACIAYCDGSGVSVVTVYRLSDGAEFNAFKFQLDGVDYYYILDEDTQIDLILALRYDPSTSQWLSKTFSSNDWWWSGIISQQEADAITNIGIGIITKSDTTGIWNGPYGSLNYNSEFDYELKNFYSDMGVTPVTFDKSNFFLEPNEKSADTNYGGGMIIHSIAAYNTSTMTYKILASKGGNRSQIMYLAQDRSSVRIYNQEWHQLYRRDGVAIKYVGIIPILFGYFMTANSDSLSIAAVNYLELRNNNGLLEARVYGMTSLDASRIAVRWPDAVILAYKQDGTTATCYKCLDKYMFLGVDSTWRTEVQLNSVGWYVKWRKYSVISSSSGSMNVRPSYGTDNTPIATFDYGETVWANPYLTGPSGYTAWLNIIISTDGGATTQSAWFDSSNTRVTYVESETDTNICLL